jgi:hypothetical protein
MSAPERCPCGAIEIPDGDAAASLLKAHSLIKNRKLAVPDVAMDEIRTIAAWLRCKAGLCGKGAL